MIETERREILRMLQEGGEALRASVAGIEEEDTVRRPAPDRWSVLECVEHVAASEAALLSRLREATPRDESHEDPVREAKLEGLARNRARRIEAPEQVRPTGNAKNLADALARFNTVRSETVHFVEQFGGDMRWWLALHPMIPRPVNCYEMLLLMALHPKRHAEQIEEIRAGLVAARG